MAFHSLTIKAKSLLSQQAGLDVELLETLTAIFKRSVHLEEACHDLRSYCVKVLGMSDDSAYRRIYAANLLDRYPVLVRPMIEDRSIHLTGLAMLHGVITDDNAADLLAEARGKTKAEIDEIICRVRPRAEPKPVVRRIAAKHISKSAPPPLSLTASEQCSPLEQTAPVRTPEPVEVMTHWIRVSMTEKTHDLLQQAQNLLPDDDLNEIWAKAIAMFVDRTMMKRRLVLAQTPVQSEAQLEPLPNALQPQPALREAVDDGESQAIELETLPAQDHALIPIGPKSHTRYISAGVARAVFVRDNNRCQFENRDGTVCGCERRLQLHHLDPWAKGGETTVANLSVRCRGHNLYQAVLDFGPEKVFGAMNAAARSR